MTDLDELERLARAATPGPWEWEEPSDDPWPVGDESLLTTWNAEDGEPNTVVTSWGYDADGVTASAEDRAFIAAAYPQVVLELIERVRRVEAERDAALARIAELEARAEEVSEDEGWHVGGAWGDYGEVVVPLRILSYVIDGKLDEKIISTDPGYALTYAEQVARANEAEDRIAEAAKLHYRDTPSVGGDWCPEDHHKWPCPTAVALGLNEGENND